MDIARQSPVLLVIDDLSVAYQGGAAVLEHLSLNLERGEIGCLVGSSGCGKTTVLRAIAGFLPVATGTIEIDGVVVSGPHFTAPPERRSVGLVFQDYALFPHLTVESNAAFGLRALGPDERTRRAPEMLDLVGLRIRQSIIRMSFRAASSRVSRWRGRSRHGRRFC